MNPLAAITANVPAVGAANGAPALREAAGGFADALARSISTVETLQSRADEAAAAVASGQARDVHTAMVAMEEASLAFQLAVQVRNKLLEGYQELARMQI
jgi:flagellar hook-basal body complex protein FliE